MTYSETLAKMTGLPVNANMVSVEAGLDRSGADFGVTAPAILAHYFAQLAHESASFRYDREIWGPTPAQSRYDTRTDLGNTAKWDGDGKLYSGRTGIQITGKANFTEFRNWCREHVDAQAPDFVQSPELVNTDPWEGLGPLWYWSTRKLNTYADVNDIEMVTRKINGGLNGYDDRIQWYTKAALVLLGRSPKDIRGFQTEAKLTVDGIAGPRTRAALHGALKQIVPPTTSFWSCFK